MVSLKPLRIGILGTRGVPPVYGGFETFAAELGTRLAARSHQVFVYCRRGLYRNEGKLWQGIHRVELPAIRHKYLETVSHAALSAMHALSMSFDVLLVCNAANAFTLPLFRAVRVPVAINVDGIERQRKKWNRLGRMVYQIGETFSARFSNALIADAEVIAGYYRANYAVVPEVIAYGSDFPAEEDSDVLKRLSLEARRYFLYVSRMEPENNPLAVRDAYGAVRSEMPLVMVGDAPYSAALIGDLRATEDPRVKFPGGLYGADYRTLQRNALVYLQATEVGGTHPAMIEAMGSGGAVLAYDTPENREAGGEAVRYFQLDSLSVLMQWAAENPEALDALRSRARSRARSHYSWDAITDRYESLFRSLAR